MVEMFVSNAQKSYRSFISEVPVCDDEVSFNSMH